MQVFRKKMQGGRGDDGGSAQRSSPSSPGKRTCKEEVGLGPAGQLAASGGAPGSVVTAGGPHPLNHKP